jgi:Protein of unknown function (DUF3396)
MNFSDYQLEQDGLVLCEPCLCISLFSDLDLAPPGSPDMLGPYRAFLEQFQKQVTYCRLDGDQMHSKKVTPELLLTLPKEMQDDKRRKKGGVTAEIKSGKSDDEFRAPSFDFRYSKIGQPHTALRICVTLDWFKAQGIKGLNKFLHKCLNGFPFQAGYVGFCFAWSDDAEAKLDPYFLRWLQRHPGLMEPMFAHGSFSYLGLTDIGWITLLGADFVKRMGGQDALKKQTAHIPGVHFDDMPNGAVGIRMGDEPRLGDTFNGDEMEDYQALGKVLAPLRNGPELVKSMAVAGMLDREHPGLRAKWINRFFP